MNDAPPVIQIARRLRRKAGGCMPWIIGGTLYVLIALFTFPPKPFLIEYPVRILVGWLFELPHLPPLPRFSVEAVAWTLALLAAATLAGCLVLRRKLQTWRMKCFFIVGMLAALTLVAGIALAGAGRHFSQLGDGPVILDPHGFPEATRMIVISRHLEDALAEYVTEHGVYPTTLYDVPDYRQFIPRRYKEAEEPFILLCSGQKPGKDNRPIAVSPVYYHQERLCIYVIRANHTTQQLPATELDNILKEAREPSR